MYVSMPVTDSQRRTQDVTELSYALIALNKKKIWGGFQKFSNTRFIVLTTNLCERFFSRAENVPNDKRGNELPPNLHQQQFFHPISSFWNTSDFQSVGNYTNDCEKSLFAFNIYCFVALSVFVKIPTRRRIQLNEDKLIRSDSSVLLQWVNWR